MYHGVTIRRPSQTRTSTDTSTSRPTTRKVVPTCARATRPGRRATGVGSAAKSDLAQSRSDFPQLRRAGVESNLGGRSRDVAQHRLADEVAADGLFENGRVAACDLREAVFSLHVRHR